MKRLLLSTFLWLLLCFPSVLMGQLEAEIAIAVDSLKVKIGEQINVSLQVKTDSLSMVEFPPEPSFLPFEILEESAIDTLRSAQHYFYTKHFALIQFDSGRYWIPPQKIIVDGFSKFSDSVAIVVATVKVDTLQQPMFDIKPIQLVDRSYTELIKNSLIAFVFIMLITALYFLSREYRKKKEALQEGIPPFERALNALKAMEKEMPSVQEEYKNYYSRLTDVVRRYLEEEAAIDALESTSDELIEKLELRKDAGTLELNLETLNNLKKVLNNADLVKFARSAPALETATNDRTIVEQVVIETKEALPEPTQEELEATIAYQKALERKRRIQKMQLIGISSLSVIILVALISIAYYGFTPVKDTLFRYPTKVLLDGSWIKSQYGAPPVSLETPKVLMRDEQSTPQQVIYNHGNPLEDFYTQLIFQKRSGKNQKEKSQEEQEAAAQELIEAAISKYEDQGAVNLLVQNDTFSTQQEGVEAFRLFGTLDLPKEEDFVRCRFVTIIFPFEEVTIELQLVYPKDDRYGDSIEQRLLQSLEIIKEL